jgi:acyl dehydratase
VTVDQAVEPVPIADADALRQLIGRSLGPSAWLEVPQADVDAFGRAVHDWHWAHNDPEQAGRGPFGGTIAHAHLTLALVPHLRAALLNFARGECMFYGYDRVRFPTAVPVGSRVRARATITAVDEISGGEQLATDLVVEIEGVERPACVAHALFRHYDLGGDV